MATSKKTASAKEDEAQASDTDAMHGVVKPEGSPDETVPGGRYKVDGRLVNAEGEEIKK